MARGENVPRCLVDFFFHSLKNLLQLVSARDFEGVSDSVVFSLKGASDSEPLKQVSKTPLGDDASMFSLFTFENLKSTKIGNTGITYIKRCDV